MLSLVNPAFGPVTNLLFPSIVLINVDLPELGFPIKEIFTLCLLFLLEIIMSLFFIKFLFFISEL